MKNRMLLRAMVAAADATQALALQARLMHKLQAWAPQAARPPERYWKVPQWVELTLALTPANPTSFAQVMALQPQGWTVDGDEHDRSAVWNPPAGAAGTGPGPVLEGGPERLPELLPELQWAELILERRSA